MQTIVVHIDSKVRRAKLHGRDHIVAPMTMIVPGVLNGSDGPLLYPVEEVSRDPSIWNHMPIVRYHPESNGRNVSARDPEILDKYGIGVVLRAKFDDALKAEAWFDVERVRELDPQLLRNIERGKAIELSTGLFLEAEQASEGATFNGVRYDHIARNYKPDHLAVLPDEIGACSIKDGCGVFVNEDGEKSKSIVNQPSHSDLHAALASLVLQKFGGMSYVVDVFDKFIIYQKDGELYKIGYSTDLRSDGKISLSDESPVAVRKSTHYKSINRRRNRMKLKSAERKAIVDDLIANCDCWDEADRETLNEMSDDKLHKFKLHEQQERQVAAVYNTVRQSYIDLHGNEPATVDVLNEFIKKGEEDDDEEDAEDDDEMPEKMKEKMKGKNKKAAKNSRVPVVRRARTTEEWLAEAPPDVQSAVRNSMEIVNRTAAAIIQQITANITDANEKAAKQKYLATKPLDELRTIADLIGLENRVDPIPTVASYLGAGVPPEPSLHGFDENDVLPLPSMNMYLDDEDDDEEDRRSRRRKRG